MKYNFQGLQLRTALPIAGISKSQYYYQKQEGKSGRKPSENVILIRGGNTQLISNQQMIHRIQSIQKDPDLVYGYHCMTKQLQQEGYWVNHKKVYRLMRENQLLYPKQKQTGKTYVKYRKVHPVRPLEVLEMDIKMVWVETDRRHAFVLNIIDTFSRKWLYQSAAFTITQHQVKQAWQYLIEQHLQPADLLQKNLHLEIRNDNDKRFSAHMIQSFFKENHLNQVFTHPYTPQENGHVESFHNILGIHLKRFTFWSLQELDQNLLLFREKYNNVRLHGSIAHLCPNDFETLQNLGFIIQYSNIKQRKSQFILSIPRHEIQQHTAHIEPQGSSSHGFERFDTSKKPKKEISGAKTSNNLRYKKSPSVVPRTTNLNIKDTDFKKMATQYGK